MKFIFCTPISMTFIILVDRRRHQPSGGIILITSIMSIMKQQGCNVQIHWFLLNISGINVIGRSMRGACLNKCHTDHISNVLSVIYRTTVLFTTIHYNTITCNGKIYANNICNLIHEKSFDIAYWLQGLWEIIISNWKYSLCKVNYNYIINYIIYILTYLTK